MKAKAREWNLNLRDQMINEVINGASLVHYKGDVPSCGDIVSVVEASALTELEAEVARLREGLKFYAFKEYYVAAPGEEPRIIDDYGSVAQAALAKDGTE